MSSNIRIPKTCQLCGKAFIAKTTVTQYCSSTCGKRAYKKRKRDEKLLEAIGKEIPKKQGFKTNSKNQPEYIGNKEFLCIKETAQLLGVSRWTIQRLIQNKKISNKKIGLKTLIPRSSIDKLFEP